MGVQVSQASRTADFTSQHSSVQKSPGSEASKFLSFLNDARNEVKTAVINSETMEQGANENIQESIVPEEQISLSLAEESGLDGAVLSLLGLIKLEPEEPAESAEAVAEAGLANVLTVADETMLEQTGTFKGQVLNSGLAGAEGLSKAEQAAGFNASTVPADVAVPLALGEAQAAGVAETGALNLQETVSGQVGENLKELGQNQVEIETEESGQNKGVFSGLMRKEASSEVLTVNATVTGAGEKVPVQQDGSEADALLQGKTGNAATQEIVLESETADTSAAEIDSEQLIDVQALNGTKAAETISNFGDKTQIAAQVQDAIIENYEVNTDKTFKVTLNPECLGEIDVEMAFSNGKLTINILAASQETHELLAKQIDQLVRGLAMQKINVETVTTNRTVEETADSGQQSQSNLSNMDSRQNQSQSQNDLIQGRFNRFSKIGLDDGENLDETLTGLVGLNSQNSQLNRMDYFI
ncbi:flagellar hook-length control protein FliK [Eubacteriaceae bacterium ES3]|nr:flagellar hook-length control protein FliK [Eubacteriaceae bacterium ES3]